MNRHDNVLIKLYFRKQIKGLIWPVGHCSTTIVLEREKGKKNQLYSGEACQTLL